MAPPAARSCAPSDGKEAKNVAFIQCAGSRDENHLRHCSRICCMASLKQTNYVREAFGDDGKSTIYYIDIRAIDRFEDFYQKVQKDATVKFVKSKVAKIVEDEQERQPDPARRRHRGLLTATPPSMTWWCSPSAWSPASRARTCRRR